MLGEVRNNVVEVDSVFSSPVAFHVKLPNGTYMAAKECPAGTVADAHTHPFEDPLIAFPSVVDWQTAMKLPYDITLIVFPGRVRDERIAIAISAWRRTSEGLVPFRLEP